MAGHPCLQRRDGGHRIFDAAGRTSGVRPWISAQPHSASRVVVAFDDPTVTSSSAQSGALRSTTILEQLGEVVYPHGW